MWGFAYEQAAERLKCKRWDSGTGYKLCLLGSSLFDALIYLKMGLECMFSLLWARGVIFSVAWGFTLCGIFPGCSAIQCPGNRALIFPCWNATPSDSIIAVAK